MLEYEAAEDPLRRDPAIRRTIATLAVGDRLGRKPDDIAGPTSLLFAGLFQLVAEDVESRGEIAVDDPAFAATLFVDPQVHDLLNRLDVGPPVLLLLFPRRGLDRAYDTEAHVLTVIAGKPPGALGAVGVVPAPVVVVRRTAGGGPAVGGSLSQEPPRGTRGKSLSGQLTTTSAAAPAPSLA